MLVFRKISSSCYMDVVTIMMLLAQKKKAPMHEIFIGSLYTTLSYIYDGAF